MAERNNRKDNGAVLGLEDKHWAAADKLRGNMDADYVCLSVGENCKNHSGEGCHGY